MLPIKMTKVKYALWDRSMHVHNHRLRQYILDTHLALKRQIPELVINQNVDRLLQDQQLQDATHIAVICSGIIVLHPGPFKKGIERHCYDSSWMISGHILLEHKTYPHISPQVFIVNVELYNQLKKPAIGTAREVQDLLLPKPVPSCEHIHHDYTPLYLDAPRQEEQPYSNLKFGWNMIYASMKNQIKVCNIPHHVRLQYNFIYWWNETEELSKAVNNLVTSQPVIFDKLNPAQTNHFEWLDKTDDLPVFVFNTEVCDVINRGHFDRFIGCAAGFKLFNLWVNNGGSSTAKIFHFDINPKSLAWQSHLISHWNGDDFYDFMIGYTGTSYGSQYNLSRQNRTISDKEICQQNLASIYNLCGGQHQFTTLWRQWQRLEHIYLELDLLSNPNGLSPYLSQNCLVWYSNIFNFVKWIYKLGLNELSTRHLMFIDACKQEGVWIMGDDPNGYAVDNLACSIT